MNDIIESVLDILDELLFENRRIESKITEESEKVILPLIKILKYYHKQQYRKHIRDIDISLLYISIYSRRGKKPFSYNHLHKWIFDDWIGTLEHFNQVIKCLKHKNSHLKIIRSDAEIYVIMKNLMEKIIHEIHEDTFDSIEGHLKTSNIFDEEQYNYISQKRKKRIELNEYN